MFIKCAIAVELSFISSISFRRSTKAPTTGEHSVIAAQNASATQTNPSVSEITITGPQQDLNRGNFHRRDDYNAMTEPVSINALSTALDNAATASM